MGSKHDKFPSKARTDNNPGLEIVSAPRFSGNTFRSPQPDPSQIFSSLLMQGNGDQDFKAASHPSDAHKEGRPRFQDNPKKSKASSGKNRLRLHDPRGRGASPRREKPEMPLYRPPRSGRPQAPPNTNTRATNLAVWGLPGDLTEQGAEFIFGAFDVVEKVTMVRDKVCFVTMGSRDQADAAIKRLNGKDIKGIPIRVEHVERYPDIRPRTYAAYEDEGRPWDSNRRAARHGRSSRR